MDYQQRSPFEFSVEELDRELIVRGARIPVEKRFKFSDGMGTPARDAIMEQVMEVYEAAKSLSPNEALSHISTEDLVKILMFKTGRIEIGGVRGTWGKDSRVDFYEIEDEQVKKNAGCVAAICKEDNLIDTNKGFFILKVKNYGKTFNLSDNEPFHHQPIAAGKLCTGVLVEEDMIATAGHCVNVMDGTDLHIVFGFKMEDPSTPVIRVSEDNIYKGVKVVRKVLIREFNKPDWALVRLDRKVVGQTVAKLSKDISCDQPVYTMGHPCGLPLKYAPGANIRDVSDACFGANLDIYQNNSGSPVFNSDTHEVIGIVARGDNRDFRWTDKGWLSIIYPNPDIKSKGPQCTRALEFIEYCSANGERD